MKRRILLLCSVVAVIMAIVAISFKSQNKKDFLYEDKQKQEIAPDQTIRHVYQRSELYQTSAQ